MAGEKEKIDREKALAAVAGIAPHAALGLMAEGLVHNLSGVAQAISMQADLLAMAFSMLGEKAGNNEEVTAIIDARSVTVERLARKSGEMQRLLHAAAGMVFSGAASAPVDVAALVADALDLAACDMFFKHRVAKEVDVAGDIPPVRAARQSLLMIVHQLLKNSAESLAASAPEGPRVRLRAAAAAGRLRIELEDNGAADELDREEIFAPFFTTREGHAGIGLWLARRLAAEAGGTLVCERLGREGALFVFETACGGDS